MARIVTATYRLQLRREFPLAAARALVAYLHRLGVSHLYLSPLLAARPGSGHGYDVVDPARQNPELGSDDDLRALAADLHERGMGIVLDIVPNHMAAADSNAYWDDVLERGAASRYAHWFDIDWDAPRARRKVVLPVLGDTLDAVLERREIRLHIRDSGARLAYFDRTFPIAPATLPKELLLAQMDPSARPAADAWGAGADGEQRLRALLDAQCYRLTSWRQASDVNYRRFFDVNDLVALRMETDAVFDATHALVLRWVREGILDGLRVDHVDGLRAPAWYLARLRAAVDEARHEESPNPFPIFVEKILSGTESLPREWPVQGTTGYDFMTDVEDLFLDGDGFTAIEASYRSLRHNPSLTFRAVAEEGKRRALTGALWADVMRAARLAHAWRFSASIKELADAIVELIVRLPVYRTYVDTPGVLNDADRLVLDDAFRAVRAGASVNEAALDALHDAFMLRPDPADHTRTELVWRIQQTSGPASAKGVEDTALYAYIPLASRNEVGGEPDRALTNAHERVHARVAARSRDWPATMLAANTHDTKRSADLRARLAVLTAVPREWTRHLNRWRRLNRPRKRTLRGKPAPDANAEYLYYQTLLGLWPAQRPERRADDLPDREWIERAQERLAAYMLKAVREAKIRTSWMESDPEYEQAVQAFVQETMTAAPDAPFLPDVARLTARIATPGFGVSLARVLFHCTAPGVPDVYQGNELWNFTLVDPDNRQPVDFELRARELEALGTPAALRDALTSDRWFENRTKLALVTTLLRFRREHHGLFNEGDYLPLPVLDAGRPKDVFAFARRWNGESCISVARTRFDEPGMDTPAPTRLAVPAELAGRWTSVLTGRTSDLVRSDAESAVSSADLLPRGAACELLHRSTA